MHFSNALFSLVALVASTVHAQAGTTVQVTVGANGALAFSPNAITAAVGTAVQFSFFPKNHSVIQSSFANPCHPLAGGGFFSTFVPTTASPSGTTFTIVVNNTSPMWIYCGQTTGNHCQSGMVAAINAPATGNTLAAFTLLAKNATTSTSPPGGVTGGVLSLAKSNSTSSSNSTSTSSSSSSTSTLAVSTGAASGLAASVFNAGAVIFAVLAMI